MEDLFLPETQRPGEEAPRTTLTLAETTTDTSWPQKTDYYCFNDGQGFEGVPVRIPSYQTMGCYGPLAQQIQYSGNFCNFACARRYIAERRGPNSDLELAMLEEMEEEWCRAGLVTQTSRGRIAPNPFLLFTRRMTLDEYRQGCTVDGSKLELIGRPFVPEWKVIRESQNRELGQYPILLASNKQGQSHMMMSLRRPVTKQPVSNPRLVTLQPSDATYSPELAEHAMLGEYVAKRKAGEPPDSDNTFGKRARKSSSSKAITSNVQKTTKKPKTAEELNDVEASSKSEKLPVKAPKSSSLKQSKLKTLKTTVRSQTLF
jgi:hypothetical protein